VGGVEVGAVLRREGAEMMSLARTLDISEVAKSMRKMSKIVRVS
jgi:hypothetical protein